MERDQPQFLGRYPGKTTLRPCSRHAQHFVVAIQPVLSWMATSQGGDGKGVLGVPGVGADGSVVGNRRSVPNAGAEPVFAPSRSGWAGNACWRTQAGYGHPSSWGCWGGQGVLTRLYWSSLACWWPSFTIGAMAGAGVGHSRCWQECSAAEGGDGLPLLVEGRGLDLLLRPAGQVHLHSDTLLLPPEQEEVIWGKRRHEHR